MNSSISASNELRQFGKDLKTRWRLWAVPTAVMTLLALVYALTRPAVWEASQALVVRDEALNAVSRQGRFDTPEAMKTTQETVLEIARNHHVVASALAELGPPAGRSTAGWPGERDVEQARDQIAVKAPKGAEFGRTEVIYLTVQRPDQHEACRLAKAICQQLEEFWKKLRSAKAESLIEESAKMASLAQADLDQATRQLEAMEKDLGSDLGELRTMSEPGAGEGNLRPTLTRIQDELRHARGNQDVLQKQRSLLTAAAENPDQVLATSGQLLESQPALKRLKDGLVDAQLRKAELMGKMSADHPHVITAAKAEEQVRSDLRGELQVAIRGVDADLAVNQTLVQSLENQQGDVRRRLDRLAGLRASYSNLVAEVRRNTETVERAHKALADARASQGAAQSASLITRLDDPLTGSRPVGMGAAAIVLTGLAGGLATGLGLVFLSAPVAHLRGRRWSDYFPGRRATDRPVAGRRAEDRQAAPPSDVPRTGRRATDPPLPPDADTPVTGERRSGTDRRGGGQPVQATG
jgi:uncharacterized protein involved in exopolysaccharide biosynthesis